MAGLACCSSWIIVGLLPVMFVQHGSAYDGYSACPKQYRASRYRAQLPCDFRQQSWCTIPGSAYPWHAVRRFVQDNHGLMRRMYGDERHISVLRAEIESNDVELVRDPAWQMEEDVKRRYSAKPHFRPANRSPLPSPPPAPPEPLSSPSPPAAMPSSSPPSSSSSTISPPSMSTAPPPSTAAGSTPPDQEKPIPAGLYNGRIHPHLINASLFSSSTSSTPKTASSPDVTTVDDWTTHNSSDEEEATEDPTQVVTTISSATADKPSSSSTATPTSPSTTTSSTARPSSSASLEEVEIEENVADDTQSQEASAQETLFQDAPELQPGPDAAQQPGKQSTPLIKLRGVNACPVKEEVVAPFWANNTRGEVLALLNLYPFEQYVHWEKCTHEHKQMFCREGCRCEQQYRLHRLLAYDPNNECRGIFSDWFKFPSCCTCRCYDLPAEMRFTSRSPRTPVFRPGAASSASAAQLNRRESERRHHGGERGQQGLRGIDWGVNRPD